MNEIVPDVGNDSDWCERVIPGQMAWCVSVIWTLRRPRQDIMSSRTGRPIDLHRPTSTIMISDMYIYMYVVYYVCRFVCVKKSGKQMESQTLFLHFLHLYFPVFFQRTCDTFVIRNPRRTFWYIRKKSPFHLLSLTPPTLTVLDLLGTKILTSRYPYWEIQEVPGLCYEAAFTQCRDPPRMLDRCKYSLYEFLGLSLKKVPPTGYFKQQKFVVSQSGTISLSLRCWQRWFLLRTSFFTVLLSKHSLFSLPVCVQISSLYGIWIINLITSF